MESQRPLEEEGPATRRIARAAAIMAVASLASRLLGVLRAVTVAALFGAGDAKGAFVIAYYVPFFVQRLLLGGTLSIVFIPTITRYLTRGDTEETRRVTDNLLTLVVLVGVGMVLFGQLASPWIIPLAAPGFGASPGLVDLTVSLARIVFAAMLFLALSVFMTGYLQSHQSFAVPAFAPLLFNVTVIGGTLVLAPGMGIHGLAVAWVAGTALQFLVQLPAAFRVGFRYRPRLELSHPALREIAKLALPAMLGLAVVEINAYVGRFFASFLPVTEGVNAVAVLDFAWEIVQAPVGFLAISIATAIFPLLSRYAGGGDLSSLRRTASLGLRAVIFVTAPALAVVLAMPDLVVRILFERHEFTPQATAAVAPAVAAYGIGLVPIACFYIVTRVFYALHDMVTPVRVGAVMIPLNAALVWVLMQILGHVGIALASSITVAVNVAVLFWLLRRRLGSLDGRRVGRGAARALAAGAAMAAVVWGVSRISAGFVDPAHLVGQAVQLFLSLGAGGIVYLAASALLRAEELRVVVDLLRRRGPVPGEP